jgi:hypothetical protein
VADGDGGGEVTGKGADEGEAKGDEVGDGDKVGEGGGETIGLATQRSIQLSQVA